MVPFTKPFLSYEDQITQLKSRGLKIENEEKAIHILQNVGYFRLSGYWYPLLETPKNKHKFKSDSVFETVFKLYCFDNELRKLVFSEIIKIEVAIRTKMIHVLSESNSPFWHTDYSLFNESKVHDEIIKYFKDIYSKSDEQFIKSFKKNYTDSVPPCWMILEIASFGKLSRMYSNLKPSVEKRAVANYFGLDENIFASWLHALVYTRNICAHNTRLWNRVMSITPQMPTSTRHSWIKTTTILNTITGKNVSINNRTYFILSIIRYLLLTINPQSTFNAKIIGILTKYPMIDKKALGFPDTWDKEDLWKVSEQSIIPDSNSPACR
jgi:abortive infection bacteriophage resistance protein